MDLDLAVLLGALLFIWTMWAVLFWGSIALLERHNQFNTFGWALVWSVVEMIASVAMSSFRLSGIGVLVAWIVFLMRLLLNRYELGFFHALGVVIATVVGPYFVMDWFLSLVGSSATLFLIFLYAFPIAVLLVWRWPRPAPEAPTNLPQARLTRFWQRQPRPPRPSRKTPVASPPIVPTAVPPPPVAAPPIVPTVAPPPPVAAPSSSSSSPSSTPRADDEPSFLR
jgi:hypothetical protein